MGIEVIEMLERAFDNNKGNGALDFEGGLVLENCSIVSTVF